MAPRRAADNLADFLTAGNNCTTSPPIHLMKLAGGGPCPLSGLTRRESIETRRLPNYRALSTTSGNSCPYPRPDFDCAVRWFGAWGHQAQHVAAEAPAHQPGPGRPSPLQA